MALITCPNCGKPVSDKAELCPHCNYQLKEVKEVSDEKHFCAECGAELSGDTTVCSNCGCPVVIEEKTTEEPQKVEVVSVNFSDKKKAAKKYVISSIAVALVLVLGIVIFSIIQKQNAANISANYSENLSTATTTMLVGAVKAESAGNLIKSVWYNTIYEERDTKTDKYTRNDWGTFNDDFNDSLSKLFSDSSFKIDISAIEINQSTVSELMKALKNPPEEYEEAYDAIKELYDSYLELTNLAINPSGSLQTFSSNFNNADSEVSIKYNAMKIYIE